MPTFEFIKFSKEQKGDKYQKRKLSDKIDQKMNAKFEKFFLHYQLFDNGNIKISQCGE